MLAVVGVLVVRVSVIGGFLLEGGPMGVLIQPVEMWSLWAAAFATLLIGTPMHPTKALVAAVLRTFKGATLSKAAYLEALVLQYELFVNARKHGFIALERDIAEPDASAIFGKYPGVLSRHHGVVFLS